MQHIAKTFITKHDLMVAKIESNARLGQRWNNKLKNSSKGKHRKEVQDWMSNNSPW